MKIRAKQDTLLKTRCDDSTLLDDDQVIQISKGTEIEVLGVIEHQNHWAVDVFLYEGHTAQDQGSLTSKDQGSSLIDMSVKFLLAEEGLKLEAYADLLHGWDVPTIGLGTTVYPNGKPVKQGDKITKQQSFEYAQDYIKNELISKLEKIPNWSKMNINQKTALISFGYNLGPNFYGGRRFTSITLVCDSPNKWFDRPWVTEQFIKYREPGTNVEQGLKLRREREAYLFSTQD